MNREKIIVLVIILGVAIGVNRIKTILGLKWLKWVYISVGTMLLLTHLTEILNLLEECAYILWPAISNLFKKSVENFSRFIQYIGGL